MSHKSITQDRQLLTSSLKDAVLVNFHHPWKSTYLARPELVRWTRVQESGMIPLQNWDSNEWKLCILIDFIKNAEDYNFRTHNKCAEYFFHFLYIFKVLFFSPVIIKCCRNFFFFLFCLWVSCHFLKKKKKYCCFCPLIIFCYLAVSTVEKSSLNICIWNEQKKMHTGFHYVYILCNTHKPFNVCLTSACHVHVQLH